jgi:hypothetical protein
MSVRVVLVDAAGLAPYAAGLRALERDITYPLDDGRDRFWIDHGPDYHPFFSHMGEAHFLVALEHDLVVGTVAGVLRTIEHRGATYEVGYACDLKLAASHRGRGVARSMLLHGLGQIVKTPRFRRWRYAFGAAMRGERGDVMRSARGLHPAKLFRPDARLRLYFVDHAALGALDPAGCPPNPTAEGLVLSPRTPGLGIVSTAGRKDLRRVSTGQPWPLVHLTHGPHTWPTSLGHYLRAGAEALAPDDVACFGLDERLDAHVAWLAARGLRSDTVCTIYGWRLPGGPRASPWVHLATSEI